MEEKLGQQEMAIIVDHTVAALREYIEETGSSQTAVARACGLSGPVISQILKGEYKGDVHRVLTQIQDFLTLEDEREGALTSSQFVRTDQSDDVLTVCSMAHRHRFIGLVLARAGLGKTTTLREYCANRPTAKMVTASTFNCSKWALAELIISALGVSVTAPTLTRAVDQIIKKIGSGALIIIDEAQHLPRETLDGIRYIHDVAGMGLVLSGTLSFSERLSPTRIGINYEQLASRVGCRRTLAEKIEREDVKKILHNTAPGTTGEIIDYCHAKANSPGAYRTMMRYIQVAVANASAKKESLALKHFKRAEEVLMV